MRLTSIAGALALALVATSVAPAQKIKGTNASGNLIIKSVDLEGLARDPVTGVISATGGTVTGTLAGAPFTTTIDGLTITPLPADDPSGGCSVLDLHLAPISISLLGLHVDTSAICLSITAIPGGGLLGDLLCGLTDGGLPLGLLGPLLDEILGDILTPAFHDAQPNQGDDSVCTGECDILDLVLGPLDLTLLGLNVHLDNCDDGPVEVCVSATASEGLLGQLLCGLADQGGLNLTLKDIANLVKRLTRRL